MVELEISMHVYIMHSILNSSNLAAWCSLANQFLFQSILSVLPNHQLSKQIQFCEVLSLLRAQRHRIILHLVLKTLQLELLACIYQKDSLLSLKTQAILCLCLNSFSNLQELLSSVLLSILQAFLIWSCPCKTIEFQSVFLDRCNLIKFKLLGLMKITFKNNILDQISNDYII